MVVLAQMLTYSVHWFFGYSFRAFSCERHL